MEKNFASLNYWAWTSERKILPYLNELHDLGYRVCYVEIFFRTHIMMEKK